jgi:mannose-6-phosphate isomerase-like protein (cupin superfamily)
LVIEGEGQMSLADKSFKIKKGDLVFIPKNTIHSVKTTSKQPLKVVSIQAPLFDGKDRISIEEK